MEYIPYIILLYISLSIFLTACYISFQSFCKYKFFLDDKHISTSEEAGMNPNFKFANKHSYNPCTEGVGLQVTFPTYICMYVCVCIYKY